MSNFPKLPKLYYYLAGLAIFILTLGGTGLYFYQKQNTPIIPPNVNQTTQNSLTLNTEPVKTPNEANIKPKEESLTSSSIPENQISSASFDADPNTDVIVFKECNMVFKVDKNSSITSVSKSSQNDDSIVYGLLISSNYKVRISCGTNPFYSGEKKLNQNGKIPDWIKKAFVNNNSNNFDNFDYYFKQNGLFYQISEIANKDKNVISSFKLGIDNIDNYNKLKIFNLDENSFNNVQTFDEFNKNQKINNVTAVNIIGCSETANIGILRSNKCFILNQDFNPIIDFTEQMTKLTGEDYRGTLLVGKKKNGGNFILVKQNTDYQETYYVYELNYSGIEMKYVKTVYKRFSATSDLGLDDLVDRGCAEGKTGENLKPCFKKSSDFQDYIKPYEEELAQNKAAQAELAKYLE
jgi:hypothetical protein